MKVEKINESAYFVVDDSTKYIVDFSSNTDRILPSINNDFTDENIEDKTLTKDEFIKSLKRVSS